MMRDDDDDCTHSKTSIVVSVEPRHLLQRKKHNQLTCMYHAMLRQSVVPTSKTAKQWNTVPEKSIT